MPRSLVSFWKRVATSGPTVDGRDILPQELRDIAETYKPSLYTAVIWCEHERCWGSFGTVYAVRLIEDADDLEPGQVALEAQLKPNDKLLRLNDMGEKLFTSIEIRPNFRGTGKAYMTGIAVTDEPASVGTQELYFSAKSSKDSYFAASQELGSLSDDEPRGEMSKLITVLTGLFKRFTSDDKPAETPTPTTESKPPMDEATATALKALLAQLLVVAAGIQAVIEPVAEEAPEPEQAPIDDVSAAVDEIVATAEEQREFARKGGATNQAVLTALNSLQKQFSALQNTPTGRQLPRTSAPVQPPKKRVF
ncbi:GPO family capsid scaffolding protein [Pseudomonas putida]|uniref:GPO family capsid scaffolding protein n=1 Tax=Pseudomonas putida TaxID=303 RepID=UPI001C22D77F|nr:GPO family capsid scaffolding protein [Pseudomonas putida]